MHRNDAEAFFNWLYTEPCGFTDKKLDFYIRLEPGRWEEYGYEPFVTTLIEVYKEPKRLYIRWLMLGKPEI